MLYIYLTTAAVLIGLLIWLGIVIYKKQKLLSQLKNLRTHIASDLHDEIGAALSSVSFYSEAALIQLKNNNTEQVALIVEKIGLTSRKTIDSMSDIVWMINPNNDNLLKLFERIENSARELLSIKNINFIFYNDPSLNNLVLNIEVRKNIYLICREAIHNAAKYAQANQVELLIKFKRKKIIVIVKDDGIGFNNEIIKQGNGLINMKVRAKQIGGEFQIISKPNRGTILNFKLPYPPQ